MSKQWMGALIGIGVSNVSALVLVLLTRTMCRNPNEGIYIFSTFTVVPVLMGLVLEMFRARTGMTPADKKITSIANLAVAYSLCWMVLGEGEICLVMALPLVLLFHAGGVQLGYSVGKLRNRTLNLSITPMLLLIIAMDVLSPHRFHNSETDRILIHARTDVVWRYIVSYPANNSEPDYWLWRIGLPAPVESTASAQSNGAGRLCRFTGNIAVEEKITDIEPVRRLAFDVTRQPQHPEVIGHFTLERGEFVLQNNGDGTTTLTGTSWYHLNVYPALDYDIWVQDIVGHVHHRVMQHIRKLAEADAMGLCHGNQT